MTSMSWTTTPDLLTGVLAARPAGVSACAAAVPASPAAAPAYGTRVPSVRLRALTGGMPFGAGTAADARHTDDIQKQNTSTLGIHSPGRPLS